VFGKLRNTLYDLDNRPKLLQFHAGLGGKEVRVQDIYNIGEKIIKVAEGDAIENLVEWV
jgi:pyruvate ferredoxin oxidoreductase alpha subunit